MNEPDISEIAAIFLNQGLSVCYIDKSPFRRMCLSGTVGDHKDLKVMSGDMAEDFLPHFNVIIAVNEHKLNPIIQKRYTKEEYFNNVRPIIIKIDM